MSSSRMDCVDKNVLIYLILSLPLGNSWKLGVFSPCIESRGDWTSWSTSPLPFGYRIWQVRNPNLVLLPVSTGILKVRLSLFFFSVCGKAVLQQALKSGGFCVLVSERLLVCCTDSCFAVLFLKNFANCLNCKLFELYSERGMTCKGYS